MNGDSGFAFTSPRVLHRLSFSLFRELRVGFVSCSVVSFTNLTRRVGVVKEGPAWQIPESYAKGKKAKLWHSR